ncbi:insulin-degrading enzyme-like isoform X2 [Harpegnathos saltator]|uniref:insulin-degrading enzyme-like isoform X2 n=1 Tax=Harpegnathos saltator TaxID=610380 RepID=UPI00058CAA15|nr:insulin-degrading enzyme-like isoform X2 [Harpegnathos saltator]
MVFPHKYVKLQYNRITKPENDEKLYKGLTLTNDMQVLLISDPLAKKSSAALVVDVGYISDPDDLPGLAHLCQHMLLLGSKKYPEEFEEYISQYGGMICAEARIDHTYYYFEINLGKLEYALDRFAQAFIAPLFSRVMIEREVDIIDSKCYKRYSVYDANRFCQLRKQIEVQNPVVSKFEIGNKQTLDINPKKYGIDVKEKLASFFQGRYSANIMSLCVFSNENVNNLEKTVVKLFHKIPNKKIQIIPPNILPYKFQDVQKPHPGLIYITSKENTNILVLSFSLPDLREKYMSKPMSYISYILAYEGEGSLYSILKAKGWCDSLTSKLDIICKGYNFFSIHLNLTKDKFKYLDDIAELVFQYFNWLEEELSKSQEIDEMCRNYKIIINANFHYNKISASFSNIVSNAKALLQYPMSDVLTAERIISKWDKEEVALMMSYLQPTNMTIYMITKHFESVPMKREPWYGIMYMKQPIKKILIKKWHETRNKIFSLTSKNKYEAPRFAFEKVEPSIPSIIKCTPFVRLWYARDNTYATPRNKIFFDFVSPLVSVDPFNCSLNRIFLYMLREYLNQQKIAAKSADFQMRFRESDSQSGIAIIISDYDHKQDILLKGTLNYMVNFDVKHTIFDIAKEHYIEDLNDFKKYSLNIQAFYYLSFALGQKIWLFHESLNEVKNITIQELKQFVQQFSKKIHLEGLIYGNVTELEALNIVQLILDAFKKFPCTASLPPRHLTLPREICIENGRQFVLPIENSHYKDSCTLVYYQAGMQTTQSNVLLKLVVQIISKFCINILKTKEQLGYQVLTVRHASEITHGLAILVVSDKKETQYVDKKIDLCVNSMLDYISAISDEEFEKQKKILYIQNVLPHDFDDISTFFWSEILNQKYQYYQYENENDMLVDKNNSITKKLLLTFYSELIDKKTRRKLSVHIKPAQNISDESSDEDSPEINEAQDEEFLSNIALLNDTSAELSYKYINITNEGFVPNMLLDDNTTKKDIQHKEPDPSTKLDDEPTKQSKTYVIEEDTKLSQTTKQLGFESAKKYYSGICGKYKKFIEASDHSYEDVEIIKDIVSFRNSQGLFPLIPRNHY